MTADEDQSQNGHAEGNASASSSGGGKNDAKSSSPKPSPSSWNNAQVHRGRSRTRGVGSSRDEHNGLRRFVCSILPRSTQFPTPGSLIHLRGYHALPSSFGKVFNVEKRWKIIREMGSGAYGFVVSVDPSSRVRQNLIFCVPIHTSIQVSRGRDYRGGRRYQARDTRNGTSTTIETGAERDHAPSTFCQSREHYRSY